MDPKTAQIPDDKKSLAPDTKNLETNTSIKTVEPKEKTYKVINEFYDISYHPTRVFQPGDDLSKVSAKKIEEYIAAGHVK